MTNRQLDYRADEEGRAAYGRGEPQRANPYSNHPSALPAARRAHCVWLNGWRSMRYADMQEKRSRPREGSAPAFPADAVVVIGFVMI